MMGPTHALGGAAALAAYTVVTGDTAAAPLWAFGLAGLSALLPDADNGQGSILNRIYLAPAKWLTFPMWIGDPPHRGRTHSLAWLGLYMLMLYALVYGISLVTGWAGTAVELPMRAILIAGALGYGSHLLLDSLNIPGQELFWPLDFRPTFPIWHAHGIIPGRFGADSNWAHGLVHIPLTIFLSWFAVGYGAAVAGATLDDPLFNKAPDLIFGLLGAVVKVLVGIFGAIAGAIS
jgi:membrane-bound metal-dependent hydrolase YbcI (DUF457 family)